MKMVYFPAYIRLPGIYNYHFKKQPIDPTLGVPAKRCIKGKDTSNRLDTSNNRETWQGRKWDPCFDSAGPFLPTYKSWPVRAMQRGKKYPYYLCHRKQKKRHPNFALFLRNCLRQRHQWPFHNLLSTSVCMKGPRTPKNIYTIRFQVRSKLDPTKKQVVNVSSFIWVFF